MTKTTETRAEPQEDPIDIFLSDYDLWLNEDARVDLILLCNSYYERGLKGAPNG